MSIEKIIWATDFKSIGRQQFIAREVDGKHGEFTGKKGIVYFYDYKITQYIYNGKDDKYIGSALWRLKNDV